MQIPFNFASSQTAFYHYVTLIMAQDPPKCWFLSLTFLVLCIFQIVSYIIIIIIIIIIIERDNSGFMGIKKDLSQITHNSAFDFVFHALSTKFAIVHN